MVLGPLAAQYLGDMGAEVIKVEPPDGDLMRRIGPRISDDMGAFFIGNNRNKKSVVLDLKQPAGLRVFYDLVQQSDIMIHSVRSGAAKRLGISYEDIKAQNPKIIYCHAKGYSEKGPYAGRAAYDDVGQAESGLAHLQAAIAGEPRYVPSILADKVTALHVAYGAMVALFERTRTGVGQAVSVPMFETMAAFNVCEHLWGTAFDPPLGKSGYVPVSTGSRRPFRTRDNQYLCVLPYNQGHWKRFCEAVGDPDLVSDPRYATFVARQSDQPGFWAEIGRRVSEKDHDEWVDLLTKADVPFGRVNSIDDLFVDEHLQSIGFWQMVDHPTEGRLRFPGYPIEMSASHPEKPAVPPRLGEHTELVLRRLGKAEAEIDELKRKGVLGPTLVDDRPALQR